MSNDLHFRGNNPGAVQYGNFINYYQFNSPENRLEVFPMEILDQIENKNSKIFCLDIGCNAGDLTLKLQQTLEDKLKKEVFILGVDIDNTLIVRAQENSNVKTQFLTLDFMNETEREDILQNYLSVNNIKYFDITICFSITMWIHLNHGDIGLMNFIYNMCRYSNLVFLEPQAWDSYKTAVKRLRQVGEEFPHFKTLNFRNHMENTIEDIFQSNKFTKIYESTKTKFKRKLFVFKINQ